MKLTFVSCCLLIHLITVEARRPLYHNPVPAGFGAQPFGGHPFEAQPFQQSSAQANANAFSNQFGPNGFGSSAANGKSIFPSQKIIELKFSFY